MTCAAPASPRTGDLQQAIEVEVPGQVLGQAVEGALDVRSIGFARLAVEHGSNDPTALYMAGHTLAYSGAGTEEGARIIERLGYLAAVVPAIRHHHERLDGRGYPAGLRGEEVPLAARIIHVADALDAMVTKRVYRDAMSFEDALEEIRTGSGSDFCPRCVKAVERTVAAGTLERALLGIGVAA